MGVVSRGKLQRIAAVLCLALLLVGSLVTTQTAHASPNGTACMTTYGKIITYSYPVVSNASGSLQAILYGKYDSVNNAFCNEYYAVADAYVPQGQSGGGGDQAKVTSGSITSGWSPSTAVGYGGLHGTDYYAQSGSIATLSCATAYATWNAPAGTLNTSVSGCG